jgi:trk system potassium uptake protein TrkA
MSSKICVVGTGAIGDALIREASARGHKVTALEVDSEKAERLARLKGVQVIRIQEASLDELRNGGVTRAGLVLATSDDDEQNMKIIAYALELGAGRVVAIASDEEHREIFLRLGAERVVLPSRIVAERLCGLFLASSVVYDVVLNDGSRVVQIVVNDGSSISGSSPAAIGAVEKAFRVIDVIRDEKHYSPAEIDELQPGDLITIFAARPQVMDAALTSLLR